MINAELLKELEEKGFSINLKKIKSDEEKIILILKENNERFFLALPLILNKRFDYGEIIKKLNENELNNFNKIILITNKIYEKENIRSFLYEIIEKYKISSKYSNEKFNYYYENFKEYQKKSDYEKKQEIKLRAKIPLNKALRILFSDGKIRILNKIYNHEALTNTELKYYYKAIRPIIKAVLYEDLRDYLQIIDATKKHRL